VAFAANAQRLTEISADLPETWSATVRALAASVAASVAQVE
jgi:hypothetical protein